MSNAIQVNITVHTLNKIMKKTVAVRERDEANAKFSSDDERTDEYWSTVAPSITLLYCSFVSFFMTLK